MPCISILTDIIDLGGYYFVRIVNAIGERIQHIKKSHPFRKLTGSTGVYTKYINHKALYFLKKSTSTASKYINTFFYIVRTDNDIGSLVFRECIHIFDEDVIGSKSLQNRR